MSEEPTLWERYEELAATGQHAKASRIYEQAAWAKARDHAAQWTGTLAQYERVAFPGWGSPFDVTVFAMTRLILARRVTP